MSKEVKVEMSVSYDVIRQMFCIASWKVLTDEKIDELVGGVTIVVDLDSLGDAKKDTEQMLGALVLNQVLETETKPKSKFEERLEALKKQKGLWI